MNRDLEIGSNGPELNEYAQRLLRKSREKMKTEMEILGPWSEKMAPQQRAATHLWLLGKTYGQGHPGSQNSIQEIMEQQQRGSLLTWVVQWSDQPVGMVNLQVMETKLAEVVRSVELPAGTELPNGQLYHGQVSISAAMYQRLAEVVYRPEMLDKIHVVEGDVRLASEIQLPTGEVLQSGVKTQHINATSGLSPLLLCVPRYRVHPTGGNPHQELFLQSRKYLRQDMLELSQPLYLYPGEGAVTMEDIASATYAEAWGTRVEVVNQGSRLLEKGVKLNQAAGIHYSSLKLQGDVEPESIHMAIQQGLEQSRFVEIEIENHPGNVELQSSLGQLEYVIPLGVLPAERSKLARLYWGAVRPDIVEQLVEVELAKDYQESRLAPLIHTLRQLWRQKGGQQ